MEGGAVLAMETGRWRRGVGWYEHGGGGVVTVASSEERRR